MRIISLEDVKEGMIVAQTIYGLNGEILIKEGMAIRDKFLERFKSYGWEYIYINDKYSEDVEVTCTISVAVRNEAIQNIKSLYELINKNSNMTNEVKFSKAIHKSMQACLGSIDKLLDDIITEKITIVDYFDAKLFDNYKYAHSINVCIISLILGKALSLNAYELYQLGVGAFFHDMGQMFIPDEVLNKEDTYTKTDIKIMRQHPKLGYRYAKDQFNLPTKSYLAILQHHERYDGSGYPHGRAGNDISLFGRIVAVADVFDALTSVKKYREAMKPVAAFKYLINNSGKVFDPKILKLFISKVSPYPIGFTLHLPNDIEAIVIKNYEDQPLHPKIKVYKENGTILETPYIKRL